jgi:V/A-type H+-transporting ATPase subunit I
VAAAADHMLKLIGRKADLSVHPFTGGLEDAEAGVFHFEQKAATLMERRQRLRDEIDLVKLYQEVVEVFAQAVQGLEGSARLAVLPFVLDRRKDSMSLEEELASTFNGRFLLAGKRMQGRVAAVIVVLKRDVEEARGVLSHQGLAELPRTSEYDGMNLGMMASRLAERSRLAPEEFIASEEALNQLTREAATRLQELWNRAKDESARLRTLGEIASGRYAFALFGWVPVSLKKRATEVADRFKAQTVHAFEPVDEHFEAERVPVMLENPGWIKPFEPLITFLNTPRYGSWDPTWVLALFLPLWFGMIVGDIGYALVFSALSWYLSGYIRKNRILTLNLFKMQLSPQALHRLVSVMKPMIAWTVVWGLLHGEFFGDLLRRFGIFGVGQNPGLIPVLIPRTDTVATSKGLILFCIGFGICQVLFGLYCKISLTYRQGEKRHFWEAVGYFSGVTALVLFSYAFMAKEFRLWLLIPTMLGGVLFFVGMIRARMPLMIAELPTQAGHILSYIRIYAVGLASAILANLATDVGFSLYHMMGIAGLVLGVLAGLLTGLLIHSILIILLTASHVLQPVRLIWVEFFTKFDFYMASGRPYRPFRSIFGPQ